MFLCVAYVFALENVYAQDDVPKTKFIVWEVQVNPSQLDGILEAFEFQNEFLKEQNYPYAGHVNYSNDGLLWYSTPFMNYSEIDEMNAVDEKLSEKHPEKQKEIWEKFSGNYKSVGSFILELQPDISVMPSSAAPTEGKAFRFFDKLHIKSGKMMEFKDIAKRYKALYEKFEIQGSYYMYYPQFGPDMSVVYLIDDMGESAAQHYSMNDDKWKQFGEEGMKLWEDFKPMVEKIETHIGTVNYDASFFPAK
jgi:hypothetical protein